MGIKIQQATLALLPSFHRLPLKREDARKTDMQSLIRIHLNHSKIIRDLEALHSLIQVLLVILASLFTDLDPLGSGKSKPFVDKKNFFTDSKAKLKMTGASEDSLTNKFQPDVILSAAPVQLPAQLDDLI